VKIWSFTLGRCLRLEGNEQLKWASYGGNRKSQLAIRKCQLREIYKTNKNNKGDPFGRFRHFEILILTQGGAGNASHSHHQSLPSGRFEQVWELLPPPRPLLWYVS